jgi:hypothetical protein
MDVDVSEVVRLLAAVPILVGVAGLTLHLVGNRCAELIFRWAADHGITIVRYHKRYVRTGPFKWTPGVPVYHVTIDAGGGKTRHAFLRLGNPVLGVISDEVEVAWVRPATGAE